MATLGSSRVEPISCLPEPDPRPDTTPPAAARQGRLIALLAATSLAAGTPAHATESCDTSTTSTPTVFWTDWQSTVVEGGVTKYYGEIEVTRPDSTVETVEVRFTPSRGIAFFQTGSGTDYFADRSRVRDASTSPFTSDDVPDIPPAAEMIGLRYGQTNTLEFSQDVGNPLFAFVSLNGNGYGFDRDFTVLSFGSSTDGNACGYWGCGTAACTLTTDSAGNPQYMLQGAGEPHGTLQFTGSFADVAWDSLRDEYWNGFTVGIAGLASDVNTDSDCDGVDDSVDNCPNDANAAQTDSDGDGIGDICDPSLDDDGDGVDNDSDNCPSDYNPTQADSDGDGVGDACQTVVTDTDGDGVIDDDDNCPDDANAAQADSDEDGLGDVCDPDADGDGFDADSGDCDDTNPSVNPDAVEVCDASDVDDDCDGDIDELDSNADCDGDGIDNASDNCPDDDNAGQVDTDGDLDGDVCDLDDDGDGVLDDDPDNCPLDANADQADGDGDGAGDVCDDDADGDSVLDVNDECLFTVSFTAPSQRLGTNRWADTDGDGVFDTNSRGNTGHSGGYTIEDTAGCTCAQIIDECGYGTGHERFGCSNSVMDWWTGLYDRSGEAAFQCKSE